MDYKIEVENIKCGGCTHTIQERLVSISGVEQASIDIELGVVTVAGDDGLRKQLCEALRALGYPELGTSKGLSNMGLKAKSVVSCAVGRIRS